MDYGSTSKIQFYGCPFVFLTFLNVYLIFVLVYRVGAVIKNKKHGVKIINTVFQLRNTEFMCVFLMLLHMPELHFGEKYY